MTVFMSRFVQKASPHAYLKGPNVPKHVPIGCQVCKIVSTSIILRATEEVPHENPTVPERLWVPFSMDSRMEVRSREDVCGNIPCRR